MVVVVTVCRCPVFELYRVMFCFLLFYTMDGIFGRTPIMSDQLVEIFAIVGQVLFVHVERDLVLCLCAVMVVAVSHYCKCCTVYFLLFDDVHLSMVLCFATQTVVS